MSSVLKVVLIKDSTCINLTNEIGFYPTTVSTLINEKGSYPTVSIPPAYVDLPEYVDLLDKILRIKSLEMITRNSRYSSYDFSKYRESLVFSNDQYHDDDFCYELVNFIRSSLTYF